MYPWMHYSLLKSTILLLVENCLFRIPDLDLSLALKMLNGRSLLLSGPRLCAVSSVEKRIDK